MCDFPRPRRPTVAIRIVSFALAAFTTEADAAATAELTRNVLRSIRLIHYIRQMDQPAGTGSNVITACGLAVCPAAAACFANAAACGPAGHPAAAFAHW